MIDNTRNIDTKHELLIPFDLITNTKEHYTTQKVKKTN